MERLALVKYDIVLTTGQVSLRNFIVSDMMAPK